MYINRLTKETYRNRKEAKIALGTSRFNRMFKEQMLSFVNDIPFANYGVRTNRHYGLYTKKAAFEYD